MHSALAVANYFVEAARRDGVKDLTPAKLHGLVYLAHGWLLGAAGQPIINGRVMADRDGVFMPELREAGCWGTKNVVEPVARFELDPARGVMAERSPVLAPNDPVMPALHWVWKTYGAMPSFKVAQHVREVGSPWDLIWNDEERENDEPKLIPNGTIKLWFKDLSSKRQVQGTHQKLTDAQVSERHPKLGDTQNMLARPDPNRLRTT